MSREELALETQLLLQEVAQVTQQEAVGSVLEDANAPPEASEFEEAKQALLAKLRKKKEASRAQRQRINRKRYGLNGSSSISASSAASGGSPAPRQTPTKAKAALQLPVASTSTAPSRKKQDMLAKLRTQAIQQGSQSMAKLFGYKSYEDQLKHLNRLEKYKIREDEAKDKQGEEREKAQKELEKAKHELEEEGEQQGAEKASTLAEDSEAAMESADNSVDVAPGADASSEQTQTSTSTNDDRSLEPHADASAGKADLIPSKDTDTTPKQSSEHDGDESDGETAVKKRRHRISVPEKHGEEDGNEADSEQDDKDGDVEDEDVDMDSGVTHQDTKEPTTTGAEKSGTPKDKAAGYRSLLRAEAMENRRRKRLVKGHGDNFVESEAEEDEDDDVLKIGGLGDFGFGVPQAKTQESREADEERKALQLREDDLEHIVDELSDEEREQQQDLEEIFRKEQEDQDRQQVKEVMRNVKEGFGRNRRAFSGLHSGSEARGRFNLDELVAADGSKFEAARLGLLESDEEMSEGEDGEKKKTNGDEEEEEEDEEAEMERLLRLRFQNQPKIYVTSSESGSDDEDENDAAKNGKAGAGEEEVESDEERERQQMKLFSERARVNRRMQRMKEMQRQMALENQEAEPTSKGIAAMPNLLLEEDEDSQELMKLLNRTDSTDATTHDASHAGSAGATSKSRSERPSGRPKLGRFNSYGITSASRGSSSFSRVIGNCKLFSSNSSGGGSSSKGFVFTSFSADKGEDDGEEQTALDTEEAAPVSRPNMAKSKSWSHSTTSGKTTGKKRRAAGAGPGGKKPKRSSGFLSVLSSFQRVSSTTSGSSAPM